MTDAQFKTIMQALARLAKESAQLKELVIDVVGDVADLQAGRRPAADEGAPPVLLLEFDAQAALAEDPQAAALREVILSLDVPQVQRSEQPFVRMREVG